MIDRPRENRRRRLVRGMRVVLTVVIVAAACYVSYGFGRMWHDWRETSQTAAMDPAAANRGGMFELLPTAGQWSFGDLDWNFRSQTLAPAEIADRFRAMADSAAGDAAAQLPDLSQELADLVLRLQIEPIQHSVNEVYLLDRPNVKAQLVTRLVGGRAKAVGLVAAYPKEADQWQLFEFTPRSATGEFKADARHLLPLPATAHRSGGRFTDDGQLLLELITIDADADTLLARWTKSGFQVRPTEFAGPDDFSYLCARGSEVIYVWSANPRAALHNLMLVRSPANADTQTQ